MASFTVRRNFETMISRAISSPSRSALQNSVQRSFTAPFCTGSGSKPIEPKMWNHEPPEEAIKQGCDYKHWAIGLRLPGEYPAEKDVAELSIKTLAAIVGSKEEAKKKIYNICFRGPHTYTGFGAEISEELSHRARTMPHVEWVMPDSYLYAEEKDYGGDLLVDGEVIHRPEYEWDRCDWSSHSIIY